MDIQSEIVSPSSPSTSPTLQRHQQRRHAPGTHLKRLSLSVHPRDVGASSCGASISSASSPFATPDRIALDRAEPASTSASPFTFTSSEQSASNAFSHSALSPLERRSILRGTPEDARSPSVRRQRPLSLYSSTSSSIASRSNGSLRCIPESSSSLSIDDGGASGSGSGSVTPTPSQIGDSLSLLENASSYSQAQHAVNDDSALRNSVPASANGRLEFSTSTPEASRPTFETPQTGGSTGVGGGGRRSLLNRSGHARRQSSISYARSPSVSSSSCFSSSNPSTPAAQGIEGQMRSTPAHPGLAGSSVNGTPAPPSKVNRWKPAPNQHGEVDKESNASSPHTSPFNEMNIGIGARSADLLTFIAKKERKCMDLREELKRHEEELVVLKKKWEAIIQREMAAASAKPEVVSPAQSAKELSPAASTLPLPIPTSLFTTITSTLTSSSSSSAASTSATGATNGFTSPSARSVPTPSSHGKRLLTSRHSISISPSASKQGPAYFGGAPLSEQESPTPQARSDGKGTAESLGSAAAGQEGYDVSRMAKSWFGGVMKSASTVLETLAPLPVINTGELGTVREEDEEDQDDGASLNSVRQKQHGRHASTATCETAGSNVSAGSASPASSSCDEVDEGRFSSNASRSSSVSSLNSKDGEVGQHQTTPVSTPAIPQETPKASSSTDNIWDMSVFEDTIAREQRERLERSRIEEAHMSSPSRVRDLTASSPRANGTKGTPTSGHGRRRSTAFELGGAWGSIVGKKWNEVANSETFKSSKRATMNFVDTFEKTLGDALSIEHQGKRPPGTPEGSSGNTFSPKASSPRDGFGGASPSFDQDKSLPSGIGSAGAWAALMGRSRGTGAQQRQSSLVDVDGSTTRSPSSDSSARGQSRSVERKQATLHETSPRLEGSAQLAPALPPRDNFSQVETVRSNVGPTSRSRHAKRMSMPSNLLTGEPRRPAAASGLGLSLESLSEEDKAEADDAWGW